MDSHSVKNRSQHKWSPSKFGGAPKQRQPKTEEYLDFCVHIIRRFGEIENIYIYLRKGEKEDLKHNSSNNSNGYVSNLDFMYIFRSRKMLPF